MNKLSPYVLLKYEACIRIRHTFVRLKKSERTYKGAVSIWGLLTILVCLVVFLKGYTYLNYLKQQNQLFRVSECSSRWLLSHYDAALLDQYGLLGYRSELAQSSGFRSFIERQGPLSNGKLSNSLQLSIKPLKTLGNNQTMLNCIQQTFSSEAIRIIENKLSRSDCDTVHSSESPSSNSEHRSATSKWEESNDDSHPTEKSVPHDTEILAKKVKRRVNTLSEVGLASERGLLNSDIEDTAAQFSESMMTTIREKMKDHIQISLNERVLLDEYLLMHFNAYCEDPRKEILDSVCKGITNRKIQCGEMEFILCGNPSIRECRLWTWLQIIGLRMGPNALHLVQCPEHRETVGILAAACTAVFPIAEPIAFGAIVSAWATAESYKDLEILRSGSAIYTVKSNDTQWKTDFLDEGTTTKLDIVEKSSKKSDLDFRKSYYSDYIRVLLKLQTPEAKVSRARALIEYQFSSTEQQFCMDDYSYEHEIILKWHGKEYQFNAGYAQKSKWRVNKRD